MTKKAAVLLLGFLFLVSALSSAQDYSQLDGKPYDPKTEPNIDMFIRSWKESMPRHIYGSLIEREILLENDGDPMRPKARGAVLTSVKRFSHGTLNANTSTTPATIEGEQTVFYINKGKGTIIANGKTAELYEGIGVLMPPGVTG